MPYLMLLVLLRLSVLEAKNTRPYCGMLTPEAATDKGSLCVHFAHNSSKVGVLRLQNSSAWQTRATRLPLSISPGTDVWWAVRDGTCAERTRPYALPRRLWCWL